LPRLAREIGEDALRDILREMRIAAALPQRDRVNEVDVAPDEFAEGRLRFFGGVSTEQLSIGRHVHPIAGAGFKTEQRKWRRGRANPGFRTSAPGHLPTTQSSETKHGAAGRLSEVAPLL
jgi:hypothetical protein